MPQTGGVVSVQSMNMNAAGDRVAIIFSVPRAGTLNRVAVHIPSRTLNGASVVRFSLQNVSLSSGAYLPDGTQDQYRDHDNTVVLSNAQMDTGLLTDDGTDGGAKRTVALGEVIALVAEFQTFTTGDTVNLGVLARSETAGYTQVNNVCNGATYNGSSWTSITGTRFPMIALEYETDGWYQVHPHSFFTTGASGDIINVNEEAGNLIQLPFKCEVIGIIAAVESGADAWLKIYDASEVEIGEGASLVFERGTAADSVAVFFDAPITIEANTDYYFVWRGEAGGNSIRVYKFALTDAKYRATLPSASTAWQHAIRSDYTTDSFSLSTTEIHQMSLIISGIDTAGSVATGIAPLTQFNGGLN